MIEKYNKMFIEENSNIVSKDTINFFHKLQQNNPDIMKRSWIPIVFFMFDQLKHFKDNDVIHCLLLAEIQEDDRNFLIDIGDLSVSSQYRNFDT